MASVKGFNTTHLNKDTFQHILSGWNSDAKLVSWKPISLPNAHGVLSQMAVSDTVEIERIVGLRAFRLTYKLPDSENEEEKDITIKSKVRGYEILQMLVDMGDKLNDDVLAGNWKRFVNDVGLCNMDHRELQAVNIADSGIQAIKPSIYWSLIDEENDVFAFAMEYIDHEHFSHIESIGNIALWTENDIYDVFSGVAKLHGKYYGRKDDIPKELSKWIQTLDKKAMEETLPLWKSLLDHNHKFISDIWDKECYSIINKALENLEHVYAIIDESQKALIHNDFSVRNMCLRKEVAPNKHRMCLYDWEVTFIGPPQRDLVEFLMFILPNGTDESVWHMYMKHHLACLRKEIAKTLDGKEISKSIEESLQFETYIRVFDMCVLDFMINRLGTYGPTHQVYAFPFLQRVVKNGVDYILARQKHYSFLS